MPLSPYDPTKSKGTLYRNGYEVPFLVAGPGILHKGRRSDVLVNTIDIYATVLDLISVPQPIDTIDESFSFRSVLMGFPLSERSVNIAEFYQPTGTVGGTAGGPDLNEGRVVGDKRFRLLSRPVINENTPSPFDNEFVCREDSDQLPEDDCFNPQTGIYEKQIVLEFYDIQVDPFEIINIPIERTMVGGRFVFEA